MKKVTLIAGIIILIMVFLVNCKKKSDTDPTTTSTNLAGNWESVISLTPANNPDLIFYMTLQQNGNIFSGNISFLDSTDVEGSVAGSVTGNNVTFSSSLNVPGFSHTFSGTMIENTSTSQRIYGTLIFTSKKKTSSDTVFISISRIFYSPRCDNKTPLKTNTYLFFADSSHLQVANPTGPPVILVHGMAGAYTNWDTIVLNLNASFFQRHKVYRYQYNWKDSIMINGRRLKHYVDSMGFSQPPLLIAHSMGGLVSRAYISSGGLINALVTLGTPHLGTQIVGFLESASGLNSNLCALDTVGPRDMSPKGNFIKNLLINPLDLANRSKYYAIDGQMKKYLDSISGQKPQWKWQENWYNPTDMTGYDVFVTVYHITANDGMVPDSSGLFVGGGVHNPLPIQQWVDHFNLVKPLRAPGIMNYIQGL